MKAYIKNRKEMKQGVINFEANDWRWLRKYCIDNDISFSAFIRNMIMAFRKENEALTTK